MTKRNYSAPAEFRAVTSYIAEGDLTNKIEYSSGDEIVDLSTSFNEYSKKMHDVILNIVILAQNLAQVVQHISSGNQNLSQR